MTEREKELGTLLSKYSEDEFNYIDTKDITKAADIDYGITCVYMEATVRDLSIFNQLNEHEYEMVSSYASSLISNRVTEHTEAYYKFQEMRETLF